jgi:hypothetical protein
MQSPTKTKTRYENDSDLVAESSAASESHEELEQVKMMKAFLEKLKEERRLIFNEQSLPCKPESRPK